MNRPEGRGLGRDRIIHGKGTGQLRERVHAILRRTPNVAAFGLAPGLMGGWGATVGGGDDAGEGVIRLIR